MGNIRININTELYKAPTELDVRRAKRYILQREATAQLLEKKVDNILAILAEEIVKLCYAYNVDPLTFTLTDDYNPRLIQEVSELMDEAEAEILELIDDYATRCSDNRKRRELLALWIATLGSRGRNLRQVTHGYLYKYMRDLEAAIAAMRYANTPSSKAVTLAKTYMHQIYNMPEVRMAFTRADRFKALYIQTRGVKPGAVGISNNGSTNLTNMAKITLQMSWMRSELMDFDEQGAVGYYQLRGSNFDCPICDDEVGFHPNIREMYSKPYPHAHCRCYRIPVFLKKDESQKNDSRRQTLNTDADDHLFNTVSEGDITYRFAKGIDKAKSDYKDLVEIARKMAQSGNDVSILTPYHVKSPEYTAVYGTLYGTKYWGKCPDFKVNNDFYEYESYQRPWNRRKVSNMLSHGLAQAPNVIIDNTGGATDALLRNMINARINLNANAIKTVLLFENKGLRTFFKDGVFV